MTISYGDKHREAWARWFGKPPGLSPELASKFMLGIHGGKTVKEMTDAKSSSYICSFNRFRTHCALNPDWFNDEAKRLNKESTERKKNARNWNRAKTHCARGHDLAIHGKLTIQKAGWKWRRCTLCTAAYHKGSGVIRAEAVDKVKEALKSGVRINVILRTIMRPPVYNLLRQRDASINKLIEATKPLRTASKPILKPRSNVRIPHLTGIIAGRPDPLFEAVSNAVGFRMAHDIRLEAISLTTMDYLEGRIDIDGIPMAARRHVAALHREQRYARSLDEPRYRDSKMPWIETLSESDSVWASM